MMRVSSFLSGEMTSHNNHPHSSDHDPASSSAPGSAASTPRSVTAGGGSNSGSHHHIPHQPFPHPPPPPPSRWHPDDPSAPSVRLMCSFGGRILPRPHDQELRYVGGDTRIVSLPRSTSFSSLLSRLSKFLPPSSTAAAQGHPPALKYQLPNEDLDALISLTSDEDVENMFDEYDRLTAAPGRNPRLRIFLFPPSSPASVASGAAFGSVLEGRAVAAASDRDQWFFDALNGGSAGGNLDRGRSEASSVLSEAPDYFLGLETNSDEPVQSKPKPQPSSSEPDSPFSTSSQQIGPPDVSYLKTKPEEKNQEPAPVEPLIQPQPSFVPASPVWSYMPEPLPFYYVPAPPVHGGRLQLPAQPLPMPIQYAHPLGPVTGGQVPIGFPQHLPGLIAKPVQGGYPVYMPRPPVGMVPIGAMPGHLATGAEGSEAPASGTLVRHQSSMYSAADGVPMSGSNDGPSKA